MLVEMRVYHCLPGRLPALLSRFRNAVPALYKKHGFKPIGYFTTVDCQSQQELTYFLSWGLWRSARDVGPRTLRIRSGLLFGTPARRMASSSTTRGIKFWLRQISRHCGSRHPIVQEA